MDEKLAKRDESLDRRFKIMEKQLKDCADGSASALFRRWFGEDGSYR